MNKIAPDAWRYRFAGPGKKWYVQKNKPDWYRPFMRDVELEPMYALSSISHLLPLPLQAADTAGDVVPPASSAGQLKGAA